MKVALILSLALALMASVSFAAPSRVKLPANAPEDISKRGKEIYGSFLEWRRSIPAYGDRSFLAYQHLVKQRELAAEQKSGPETPLAEEQQRESYVYEDVLEPHEMIGPSPYEEDEATIDDAELQDVPPDSAYGLSDAELQGLYQQWLPKVAEGEDSSFQAFLDWIKELEEQEEPEEQEKTEEQEGQEEQEETEEQEEPEEQVETEEQEEQVETEEQEDAEVTEEKRSRGSNKLKASNKPYKMDTPSGGKKTRNLEEDQLQGIDNDQESLTARDLQPSFKTGNEDAEHAGDNVERQLQEAIRTAYNGQNEAGDESQLADTMRREGEEQEGQAPVPFVEAEPQGELAPVPFVEYESQEEQTPLPFVETEPNDTNGGYSCEENSPCNIENIANEQFYFATASSDKFIQCDAWGGCQTLTCDEGLIWDDRIKTCVVD